MYAIENFITMKTSLKAINRAIASIAKSALDREYVDIHIFLNPSFGKIRIASSALSRILKLALVLKCPFRFFCS